MSDRALRILRRTACVAAILTLVALSYRPALAQADDGAYTFRTRYTAGEAIATEVQARESGTIEIPGAGQRVPQEIEYDVASVTCTRSVEAEQATTDTYVLGMRMLVTTDGKVQVDTANDRDIDLGTADPRGLCTTRTVDALGRTRGEVDGLGQEDASAKLYRALLETAVVLPENPVRVGDTWTTSGAVEMDAASAPYEVRWAFDRVEERDGRACPILVGETEISVRDLKVPTKSLTTDTPQGPMKLLIDETAQVLTVTLRMELTWDPAVQRIVSMAARNRTEATSTQHVMDEAGAALGDTVISVSREGTLTTTDRPATDEEIAQTIALALTNSINRENLDLLHSVTADGADLAACEQPLRELFDGHSQLRAVATGIRFTPDGDTGAVTFHAVVTGCTPEVRPGADVSEPRTIVEGDVTMQLTREGAGWKLREIAW